MASCNICLMDYEPIRIRPVVGTCGHTLCEPCSTKIDHHCPKCRQLSFLTPVVNYELLELLENGGGSCCHRKFQGIIKQMEKKFSDTIKEVKAEHSSKIESMKRELKQEFDAERDTMNQEFQGIREFLECRLNAIQKDTEMLKEELKDKRERSGDLHSSNGVFPEQRKQVLSVSHRSGRSEPRPSNSDALEQLQRAVAKLEKDDNIVSEKIYVNRFDETELERSSSTNVTQLTFDPSTEASHVSGGRGRPKNTEPTMKCQECKIPLPKNLPLRSDGVSVLCPKCNDYSIIEKLKRGNRWMKTYCGDLLTPHYTQVPAATKERDRHLCHVCGQQKLLWDASQYIALPM